MKKNHNSITVLITILSSIFFSIIFVFSNSVPYVDDWSTFENLITHEKKLFQWLLQKESGHNFTVVKTLLFINFNYFNFNLTIFNYLSFLLIVSSCIVFVRAVLKLNYPISILSSLILFIYCGKLFPSITQIINISWLICLFLIILFYSNYRKQNESFFLICSTIILATFTHGFGLVIPLYVILAFVIGYRNISGTKLLYFFLSILSIYFAYVFFNNPNETNTFDLYINHFWNLNFIITYFALLGNVFIPFLPGISFLVYFSAFIGFIQIATVIYFFIKRNYIFDYQNLNKFVINNSLLIMGLMFSFLIAISKGDFFTSVSVRYTSGSIIFQLGFWIFLLNETKYRVKIYFTNLLIISSIFIFLNGMFTPYVGLHWQLFRSMQSNKIINCYNNQINLDNNLKKCDQMTYEIVFYNSDWYDKNKFDNVIYYLKNNNLSFFKE